MSYSIELRDVSFRYPDADSMMLEHINLTIQTGEKIAVVGLNGAGKILCFFSRKDLRISRYLKRYVPRLLNY